MTSTKPTSHKARAALAALTGTALLAGGLGSFALWSDSSNIPGGEVNAGELSLVSGPASWTDVSADAEDTSWDPASDKAVPGDVLELAQHVTIQSRGKNLAGELRLDGVDTTAYNGYLTTRLDLAGPGAAGFVRKSFEPDHADYNTFVFAGPTGSDTEVDATVTFTFDAATPGTVAQNAATDMSDARLVLTQTRGQQAEAGTTDFAITGVSGASAARAGDTVTLTGRNFTTLRAGVILALADASTGQLINGTQFGDGTVSNTERTFVVPAKPTSALTYDLVLFDGMASGSPTRVWTGSITYTDQAAGSTAPPPTVDPSGYTVPASGGQLTLTGTNLDRVAFFYLLHPAAGPYATGSVTNTSATSLTITAPAGPPAGHTVTAVLLDADRKVLLEVPVTIV